MRIDVLSIFPELFDAVHGTGITGRAAVNALWSLHRWNPRDYAVDAYRRVDDRAYGGGPGMVMLVEPLKRALQAAREDAAANGFDAGPVILMSPQGRRLDHQRVAALSTEPNLTLIAGRYEAIDQRFVDRYVDEEVSIGDFVVSGGELPAMLLIDALVRLLPGAVNDPASVEQDSFVNGLLDAPHYTRPEIGEAGSVPPVLLSGNHKKIERWRREQSLAITASRRPDLIDVARAAGRLSPDDEAFLRTAASRVQE
ncbi:MAG: tRNA (guanosine(37)-N1)-methyltransferase TrmD [Burkholderiaceae bacterium]